MRFVGEGRNAHRKAGLMLRASLAADAPYAYAVVHGDGLVYLQYPETPGGLPDHDVSIAVMVNRYGGSCASLIIRDLSRTATWHLGTGFHHRRHRVVHRQASGAGITGSFGSNSKTGVVGLQLAVPLYQGGLVNSQVRQALANQEKARQDLENARRTAALNTRQSFLGVANGVASIRALEAAVRSSQSQLDSTRLAREVGIRTEVDVLNAQTQLSTVRRDLAQAVYTYLLSTLRLKSAIGTLGEDDIVAVNRWLDTNRPAK